MFRDDARGHAASLSRRRPLLGALVIAAASVLAWGGAALASGTASNSVYFTDVQRAGGDDVIGGNSVAVTSDGTVLVTGYFEGTAYFPTSRDESIALSADPVGELFVAALNQDDYFFDWAVSAGGSGTTFATAIAVTQDDTPVVTGHFDGTAYFPTSEDDSVALVAEPGARDIFVAAMNADDSYFAWAVKAGGAGNDEAQAVAVKQGAIPIITGSFQGVAQFPTSADDSITLTGDPATDDIFVAAMNADDSYFAWATAAGSSQSDWSLGITLAEDDTPIITGLIDATTYFPTSADDSIALSAEQGGGEVFVAALNADDSYFSWATSTSGLGGAHATALTTLDGSALLTGVFQDSVYFPTSADDSVMVTSTTPGENDAFVAKMNSDDSYFEWVVPIGASGGGAGRGTALLGDDTAVVTGVFRGTAFFSTGPDDSIALAASPGGSVFVAGMNADDSYFEWVISAEGTGSTVGNAVAEAVGGIPLVIGELSGPALFPSGPDTSLSLTATGTLDLFLAWLGPPAPTPAPPVPPTPWQPLPPTSPRSVTGTAGDASAVISWAEPSFAGSFPITDYQAVLAPGGKTCAAKAPSMACTVTELANGTSYTATVRALNGAGWSPFSTPSTEFTPRAPEPPVTPVITISGSRGEVRGKPGVLITGTSAGFDEGAVLAPWFRFPGQTGLTRGSASIVVGPSGAFTWQRQTGKRITIEVRRPTGNVTSNRVTIARR